MCYWRESHGEANTTSTGCKVTELLVDSGCDFHIYPHASNMRKYVVGGPLGHKMKINLVGKGQTLNSSEPYRVVFPVESVDGGIVYVDELCTFSDCRIGLFGAMHREVHLCPRNGAESVEVKLSKGGIGYSKVYRNSNGKPVLKVLDNKPPYSCAGALNAHKEDIGANDERAKQVLDVEALTKLHRRFAHAKGHRLFATLKKYGLGGGPDGVTLRQCHEVECPVCELLNMKKRKVPRTTDPSKLKLQVGEVTLQDLIKFPVQG